VLNALYTPNKYLSLEHPIEKEQYYNEVREAKRLRGEYSNYKGSGRASEWREKHEGGMVDIAKSKMIEKGTKNIKRLREAIELSESYVVRQALGRALRRGQVAWLQYAADSSIKSVEDAYLKGREIESGLLKAMQEVGY